MKAIDARAPLTTVTALMLTACAGVPEQSAEPDADPSEITENCAAPAWYQHAAGEQRQGWLVGLGEADTVEQARQRAMQDILQRVQLDVISGCEDHRESSREGGESRGQYREYGGCSVQTEARAENVRFDDLQTPHECGGHAWVKLGLDQRSLRNRAAAQFMQMSGQGETFCAGIPALTRSPFCSWLAEHVPGMGAVPIDLSHREDGWTLLLGRKELPLNNTPLSEVLAWNSEPRCRNWFRLEQKGQVVEALTAPAKYAMTLEPSTGTGQFISIVTVYADGRTQLLLRNQPVMTRQDYQLDGVLEPGQRESREVAIALRSTQPMDWSAFKDQPMQVAGTSEQSHLPELLHRLAETDYTNVCVQTMHLQAGNL
ncbi:MAG: hypothetical protein IPM37_15600 [Hahellaceae bacterium]|nr:hypothetical protein [Hahellaceae bacterium]